MAIPGWFVAPPVAQSQELPIELGKCPSVGRVDGSVQQLGVLSHYLLQSAAHASTPVPLSRSGAAGSCNAPLTGHGLVVPGSRMPHDPNAGEAEEEKPMQPTDEDVTSRLARALRTLTRYRQWGRTLGTPMAATARKRAARRSFDA